MSNQIVRESMPIVGPVDLKCLKVVRRYCHSKYRLIKILVNPLTGNRTYGYHRYDGKFIKVYPKTIGFAA